MLANLARLSVTARLARVPRLAIMASMARGWQGR